MKCAICKDGETRPGKTVVTLTRGGTTIVFKDVPAEICEVCGEDYTSPEVTERLAAAAEEAVRAGVEVDVRRYAA